MAELQASESLLEREEQQLRLFRSSEMGAEMFESEEARGRFTGERLFSRDPERYREIVSLLAEGMSCRSIARLTKTSINTVMAVRDREPAIIEADKQLIGRRMRGVVRMLAEKVQESLEEGHIVINNVRDLQTAAVAAGILTDKSELLLGGATSRVERRDLETVGDLDQLWEALPAETVDGDATDVQPGAQGMGFGGGKPALKGPDPEAGTVDLGAIPAGSSEASEQAADTVFSRAEDMQSHAPKP